MIKKIIFFSILIITIFCYYYYYYSIYSNKNYPNHIAFIMDGNGRWAQQNGRERTYGHENGSNHLDDIIYDCFYHGTKYLTFYVFSEQNWDRPKKEVDKIFNILYYKLKVYYENTKAIRFLVQGKMENLPIKLRKILKKLIEKTKDRKYTIILCIDYSGRNEILYACKRIIDNNLQVNNENFINNLYNKNIPDPDLIIRTSGEQRLSDFLSWQSSYSELYFTTTYWPDFNLYELKKAIYSYSKRTRRFGKIK